MNIFLAILGDPIWQSGGGILLLAVLVLLRAQPRTRAFRGDRWRPGRCRRGLLQTACLRFIGGGVRVRWVSLCLFLFVVACAAAPASSAVTPTAGGPPQRAAITAYHGQTSMVFAVAWSPDGTRIASGGNDSTVQVWEARSGRLLLTYRGHTSGVRALAWSPDGRRLVSGSNDNTIQVWDATTGQRSIVYTGHLGAAFSVAWSPDGTRIASGGDDFTVQVWNATSGHRLLTYHGHTAEVRGVTWSPDGTRIASASKDGTVQVWDAASGHRLLTSLGQTAPAWAVSWSPNGACIASATGNTSVEHPRETVQVWNATTRQLYASSPIPSSTIYADGTFSVAWSPDGTRIASGGADTIVHLWTAPALCKGGGR